jgi:hypothetical protein
MVYYIQYFHTVTMVTQIYHTVMSYGHCLSVNSACNRNEYQRYLLRGLKAALHIPMSVLALHSSVHSSPVGPLLSRSLLVICPLALPLTPLFILHTFKHSLNYFTSSLPHITVCHILTLSCDKSFSFSLKLFLIFCFNPHSFALTEQKHVAYNECLHFSQLSATLRGHN